MATENRLFVRGIIVLGLCLGLLGGVTSPVRAETCTWSGLSTAWNSAPNWSCGHIPGQNDDVVIQGGTFHPTVTGTASASTITIESGGHLTLSGAALDVYGDSVVIESGGQLTASGGGAISLYYTGGVQVTNYGTLSVNPSLSISGVGAFTNAGAGTMSLSGSDPNWTSISLYVPFNNNGAVDIQTGILILYKSGNHSGSFTGNAASRLRVGDSLYPGHLNTFGSTSSIKIPTVYVMCGIVNINGEYFPPVTGSKLQISNDCNTNRVIVDSVAYVVMPQTVTVSGYSPKIGELILEPKASGFEMQKLELSGTLTNNSDLTILDYFDWTGGKLSGSGATVVTSTATLTLFSLGKTLDAHPLTNEGTTNWNAANVNLVNAAIFENGGTFNANATTRMMEDGTTFFVNNGDFYKKTAGTTTTMDVRFANNGTVEVITGTLVFQSEFIPGENTAIDLGDGTLGAGDTLTLPVGSSLIGSGTLNSNLVNGGTVSPGDSPGTITVNGDYTQEVTGSLVIELAGVVAGTEYDQLVVTGTATLSGTLDVSLIDPYVPSGGNSYTIMTYSDHTGVFQTVNLPALPAGTDWEIDYGSTGITLDVTTAGNQFTSLDATTITVGVTESFSVTATGSPTPTISLIEPQSDDLPSGISFNPGEGTATLSGMADAGSGGVYELTFGASNGAAPDATQTFTLTVQETPTITSANSTTFDVGVSDVFTITATGYPTPAISADGDLPGGVTFNNNGDGTATLSGTPGQSTVGDYPITITASNGVLPNAYQSYTLTVGAGKYYIYLPLVQR